MLYHVTRNGQSYGPYTLEDLQKYVASGNVLPTDLAKSDEMPDWLPVSQILGGIVPTPIAPQPYVPTVVYPDPPNLHWGLVLLIAVFTCGIFSIVWDIVQAAWMRKVNPRSNALFLYIGEIVINVCSTAIRMSLMFAAGFASAGGFGHPAHTLIFATISIITVVLVIMARFDMRRSMEEHFNGPEPVGLSLSGVMTFFFGSLYFQYHMTRINELKRAARYRGAAI